MEHIVLQWDDILEKLFDELVQEEVKELNTIECRRNGLPPVRSEPKHVPQPWNYQDYQSVDLKDIMGLFDDYLKTEKSIKNRL
jgi:hypothetical protein